MNNKMINQIPVATPYLSVSSKKYAISTIENIELSGNSGQYNKLLEDKFSNIIGVDYSIAVNNGTSALHVALLALGITSGDEVLVSTHTNMATAFAILYLGAVPVPIDIELDTWNIDPQLISNKITNKTKAILVVHLFGHPADMDPIMAIAEKHNLYVVEDAAEAHGALYKGRFCGSIGNVGCFSFYANKIIGSGEGGIVTTNSKDLASKIRELKSLSYGSSSNRFQHSDIGYNYRMPNVMAALAYGQLFEIDKIIESKRYIADYYNKNIKYQEYINMPIEKDWAYSVYWMYHIVLSGKFDGMRSAITSSLSKNGIETRDSFVSIDSQDCLIDRKLVEGFTCPNANYVSTNGFYLPSGPFLKLEELEFVVEKFNVILSNILNEKNTNN